MNRHMGMFLGLVALVLVAALACPAAATPTSLVVTNGSFEDPVLPATPTPYFAGHYGDDGWWVSVNDFFNNGVSSGLWQQVNGSDGAVCWRPTDGSFAAPIPDGAQVLGSASNDEWPVADFGNEAGILQTLDQANGALGTLQPHTTYTVTVSVGKVIGQPWEGVYPGFVDVSASGEIGNASLDEWSAADGTFQDLSYSFNSDDVIGNGGGVGDELAVFIDFGGAGTVIDNVRVTVDGPGVVVPEPSTLTLLAAGMIGLLAYAWRKRK